VDVFHPGNEAFRLYPYETKEPKVTYFSYGKLSNHLFFIVPQLQKKIHLLSDEQFTEHVSG
jgi:hypothetical protein